jgi:transcription-repair coupling factor
MESMKTPQEDVRLSLHTEQLWLFSALWGEKRPSVALVLPTTLREAQLAVENLNTMSRFLSVEQEWHLLEGALSPQEQAGDIVSRLSETIHHFLLATPHHHFVVPADSVAIPLPAPADYRQHQLPLHTHETLSLSHFIKELAAGGYTRHTASQEPGSFSVRGEHVDVYLPHNHQRYTIVFHGSTIEQIVQHAPASAQRSARRQVVRALSIPPCAFPEAATTADQLLANFSLLKPAAYREAVGPGIVYDALQSDYPFPLTPVSFPTMPMYMLYENYDRVAEYVKGHHLNVAQWCQSDAAGVKLALQSETFALMSESALFTAAPASRPTSSARGYALVAELTPNKPAVHSDHGIGIFEGLQRRTIGGTTREYLMLRYAAGDTLSVPVEYAHKVTPYLGEKSPLINRLGGGLWQKTRRKAQHDAEAFARELLELAGERKSSSAHRYSIEPEIEAALEQSFPYELTPDQVEALEAIKDDLQQDRPLDRLVVGDVGFGKTELALRTARHVIANGKQVALLAPTTLLVQQHADTARQRFPDLKNQIGVLSRFSPPPEQLATREKIKDGTLQLVIGTHALLGQRTHWHNLGLVIIDEEQRFGVKHKEHFKKIRATTDFLSLSATPIPRTLSMALSGLKELSIIATPPQGRKEVITTVTRQSDKPLQDAITRELKRKGQVYLVAPKVRSLASLAHEVKELVPTARVAVAHGQLPSAKLAAIMEQFDRGDIDVLISSTIIENGLDLPNANTIIVMQATHFGLSDLYQLRGRVGRRTRQGYAYFFYNQTELTPIQRQRLTALTEASRLGSGWSLAQRDLEIRGAGNFLGAEQSGTVNQVGVQLYLDMVHDAIDQHTMPTLRRHDVEIKLPLPAIIPQHYIANDDKRSQYYQQLGRAGSVKDLTILLKKMAATYGTLPEEVTNLELVLTLQHVAAANGISHVDSQAITPSDEDPYWRLQVTTNPPAGGVPETLQKLQPLGNWSVRHHTLTHDLNEITPAFIRQLIACLT